MSARRARWDEVLLRVLPGSSPVRRMWAGTKLLALVVVTVGWLVFPGWGAAAAAAIVVAAALAAARVPVSVLPRPAWWVVALLAVGVVTAALGGQVAAFVQTSVISIAVLALGLVVSWTTPLAEVAAALQVIGAPLRRLGLPVGEWAAACAVGVRSLPMLLDEWRVLLAVHRLRAAVGGRRPRRERLRALVDLPTRALVTTLRRSREVGSAVAARGGPPEARVPRVRLRPPDLAALLVVAAGVALAVVLPA